MRDLRFTFEYPRIHKWTLSLNTTIGYTKHDIDWSGHYQMFYIEFIILGFGFLITWTNASPNISK